MELEQVFGTTSSHLGEEVWDAVMEELGTGDLANGEVGFEDF